MNKRILVFVLLLCTCNLNLQKKEACPAGPSHALRILFRNSQTNHVIKINEFSVVNQAGDSLYYFASCKNLKIDFMDSTYVISGIPSRYKLYIKDSTCSSCVIDSILVPQLPIATCEMANTVVLEIAIDSTGNRCCSVINSHLTN